MSEVKIPVGAPEHVCADLCQVIALEEHADDRYLEKIQDDVESGTITTADGLRKIDEAPPSLAGDMLDYCRANCSMASCAMKGFGTELVDVPDPNTLSPADQAKLTFFRNVDTTRACAEMADGIFLG